MIQVFSKITTYHLGNCSDFVFSFLIFFSRFLKTIDDIFKENKKELNLNQISFQNLFYFDLFFKQENDFLFTTFLLHDHFLFNFGKIEKKEFYKEFNFKLKYAENFY